MSYEIYRSTTIGSTLDETLCELVHRQIITPSIVHYILNIFDKIITQKLIYQSIKGKKESSLQLKGHLLSYRSCDQVWTLLFDSLIFTSNVDSHWKIILNNQKLKIITCPTISTTSNK
jgi:transcription initiation factor TFIIA small subunit